LGRLRTLFHIRYSFVVERAYMEARLRGKGIKLSLPDAPEEDEARGQCAKANGPVR
jgi:hypothetical protein